MKLKRVGPWREFLDEFTAGPPQLAAVKRGKMSNFSNLSLEELQCFAKKLNSLHQCYECQLLNYKISIFINPCHHLKFSFSLKAAARLIFRK